MDAVSESDQGKEGRCCPFAATAETPSDRDDHTPGPRAALPREWQPVLRASRRSSGGRGGRAGRERSAGLAPG